MRLANVKTETPFLVDFNCILNGSARQVESLYEFGDL